ncbi:hypothetical protein B4100_1039 [Heyndrickxia coagulans]|nr:hypothetical protein B4100_1039 [Heyndrickxia coagulans]
MENALKKEDSFLNHCCWHKKRLDFMLKSKKRKVEVNEPAKMF